MNTLESQDVTLSCLYLNNCYRWSESSIDSVVIDFARILQSMRYVDSEDCEQEEHNREDSKPQGHFDQCINERVHHNYKYEEDSGKRCVTK